MHKDWTYIQDFLTPSKSKAVFDALLNSIEFEQGSILLFGQKRLEPRLKSWHSQSERGYRYSGVQLKAQPYTELLSSLQQQISTASQGTSYNNVLINLYRDEHDSMGWHADDEPELGPNPIIASLSLGAARPLLFRNRQRLKGERSQKIVLESGSLLLMHEHCQNRWQHSIPKLSKTCGPRINLTFRLIL
jgi:alkylated DNA repair dioxygenase AlkB